MTARLRYIKMFRMDSVLVDHFYPLAFLAKGVLLSPESVCLSIHPSAHCCLIDCGMNIDYWCYLPYLSGCDDREVVSLMPEWGCSGGQKSHSLWAPPGCVEEVGVLQVVHPGPGEMAHLEAPQDPGQREDLQAVHQGAEVSVSQSVQSEAVVLVIPQVLQGEGYQLLLVIQVSFGEFLVTFPEIASCVC